MPPVVRDERMGPAKVAVAVPRTSRAPERSRFAKDEVPEREVMVPSLRMVPPTFKAVLMVDEPRVSNELPTFRFWDVEKYVDDASPVTMRSFPTFRFCNVERYVDDALVMVPAVAESAVVEA